LVFGVVEIDFLEQAFYFVPINGIQLIKKRNLLRLVEFFPPVEQMGLIVVFECVFETVGNIHGVEAARAISGDPSCLVNSLVTTCLYRKGDENQQPVN